jgi:hypothetical protein
MSPSRLGVFPATMLIFAAVLCLFPALAAAAGAPSDGVSITAFTASLGDIGARTETEPVESGLNLTLQNTGGRAANVTVTITENGKPLLSKSVTISPNGTYNLSLVWKLQGTGGHTAVAAIAGENVTAPATMQATCNVRLLPLVEHPSPWYTIPCAFLVIVVPVTGIWLLIRRMKGGEWLERTGNRSAGGMVPEKSEEGALKKEKS